MKLTSQQKVLVAILIVGVALLGAYWYVYMCKEKLTPEEAACHTSQKVMPFVDAVPFIVLAAILAGALTFYLLSPKPQDALSIHGSGFNKAALKFLHGDERIIITRLMEKNGEALQSELTNLNGMTKVRSHRAVKRLANRGVVEVQQKGKTNIVKLSREMLY